MAHRPVRSRIPFLVAITFALSVAPPRALSAVRARWVLAPTVAGARSAGAATLVVRRLRNGLSSTLTVVGRNLEPRTTYEVTVQGVRIGTLSTNDAGRGRARFRSQPRSGDQLLGVDPRGKSIAVHALDGLDRMGGDVGLLPEHHDSDEANTVRCCVPEEDEDENECKVLTPEKCQQKGGTSFGPGKCDSETCPQPGRPDAASRKTTRTRRGRRSSASSARRADARRRAEPTSALAPAPITPAPRRQPRQPQPR